MADFIEKLIGAIDNLAKGEQIRALLLKHLVFENVDKDCQGLIMPQREIENVLDFSKLIYFRCRDLQTKSKISWYKNLCITKIDVRKVTT